MKHRRMLPLVMAPALVVGLAACSPSGIAERLVEQGTGVDVDTDGDGSVTFTDEDGSSWSADGEGNVRVETEDGVAEMSQGDGLPDGFPTDEVPLVDAEVTSATRMTTDEGVTYQVTMAVPDASVAFRDAVDRLTAAGYTVGSESVTESDDSIFASAELNGPYQVLLLAMGDSADSVFSYTVVPANG